MPASLNFGPVTVSPGTRTFGPVTFADSDTDASVIIDRTIPGGLDSVSPAVTFSVSMFQSNNGGATWDLLAGVGVSGGPIFDRHTGTNDTTTGVNASLHPGTGRLGRAQVIIGGGSVAVQGTLTIS